MIVISLPTADSAGPVCDEVFVIVITGFAICVKIIGANTISVLASGVNFIVYVSFVFTALPFASIEGYSCLKVYLSPLGISTHSILLFNILQSELSFIVKENLAPSLPCIVIFLISPAGFIVTKL